MFHEVSHPLFDVADRGPAQAGLGGRITPGILLSSSRKSSANDFLSYVGRSVPNHSRQLTQDKSRRALVPILPGPDGRAGPCSWNEAHTHTVSDSSTIGESRRRPNVWRRYRRRTEEDLMVFQSNRSWNDLAPSSHCSLFLPPPTEEMADAEELSGNANSRTVAPESQTTPSSVIATARNQLGSMETIRRQRNGLNGCVGNKNERNEVSPAESHARRLPTVERDLFNCRIRQFGSVLPSSSGSRASMA